MRDNADDVVSIAANVKVLCSLALARYAYAE